MVLSNEVGIKNENKKNRDVWDTADGSIYVCGGCKCG